MGMNKFETVGPQFTNLTDNTGQSAAATLEAVPFNVTWSQAQADQIDANFASVAAKLAELQDKLNKAN